MLEDCVTGIDANRLDQAAIELQCHGRGPISLSGLFSARAHSGSGAGRSAAKPEATTVNRRVNVSKTVSGRTAPAMLAIAGAAILATGFQALAQDGGATGAGRYTMHKTDDGFVRLDTQTGAVALCRKQDGSWGCRTVAGAEDGGETSELERLRRENAELRQEVVRLEELLGLRGPSAGEGGERHGFKLPSEKDVDQAFDYFERMLRKFQDRLKKLEPGTEPPAGRQL